MNRKRMMRKLVGIISNLDEVLSDKSRKTSGDSKILKCRAQLLKLYDCLKNDGVEIKYENIAAAIYFAIKILYLLMRHQ